MGWPEEFFTSALTVPGVEALMVALESVITTVPADDVVTFEDPLEELEEPLVEVPDPYRLLPPPPPPPQAASTDTTKLALSL
ncbi:MAG: hypothetical protein ABI574_02545 [Burkholderiales bacterium]